MATTYQRLLDREADGNRSIDARVAMRDERQIIHVRIGRVASAQIAIEAARRDAARDLRARRKIADAATVELHGLVTRAQEHLATMRAALDAAEIEGERVLSMWDAVR